MSGSDQKLSRVKIGYRGNAIKTWRKQKVSLKALLTYSVFTNFYINVEAKAAEETSGPATHPQKLVVKVVLLDRQD